MAKKKEDVMTNSDEISSNLSESEPLGVNTLKGNIFTSKCQTLVNTVNCQGVMGAGIALEFKLRLPEMFDLYVKKCRIDEIDIGKSWLYKPPPGTREGRWVLNFPTKRQWRYPSKIEYLEAGLDEFLNTYENEGIESIAFPVLGASNGGLDEEESLSVMRSYLERCDIPVEIYQYDPTAVDDLFLEFQQKLVSNRDQTLLAKNMDVRVDRLNSIMNILNDADNPIKSLTKLATVPGVGSKTLEKCFRYVMDVPSRNLVAEQTSMFD